MRLYGGTQPARIVDILETVGGWLTLDQLVVEYSARFGATNWRSVQRVCYRLKAAGLVDMGTVPNPKDGAPPLNTFRFVAMPETTENGDDKESKLADLPDAVFWGRVEARTADWHAGRVA